MDIPVIRMAWMPIAAQMPGPNRFRFTLFIILFNTFTFCLNRISILCGKRKSPGYLFRAQCALAVLILILEFFYLRKTGTPSRGRESRKPRGTIDFNAACCPHFDFYFLTRMPYYTTDK